MITPDRALIDHALAISVDQNTGWINALNQAYLETQTNSADLAATVAFVATLKDVLSGQLFIPSKSVDDPESGPLVLAYAFYIATLNATEVPA